MLGILRGVGPVKMPVFWPQPAQRNAGQFADSTRTVRREAATAPVADGRRGLTKSPGKRGRRTVEVLEHLIEHSFM